MLLGDSLILLEIELFEFILLVGEIGGVCVVLIGRVLVFFKIGEVILINIWFVVVFDDILMLFIFLMIV